MQIIMFNDKYGLTKAVLEGKKNKTRRLALNSKKDLQVLDSLDLQPEDKSIVQYVINKYSRYKIGEIIAVAESYQMLWETEPDALVRTEASQVKTYVAEHYPGYTVEQINRCAGWKNKMFVKAEFMPHQIRITGISLEHLQSISDDDCLKEGIKKSWWMGASGKPLYGFGEHDDSYTSPREAYAALIDKVSGKGTWEKNPWEFVYDFELIK